VLLLSRLIAASAYAGAAFLFGMILGERGELGAVQYIFLAVIPIATIILAIFARKKRVNVAATGLAMLMGLLLGQQQFARAWDDCIVSADRVRIELIRHRVRTDTYPTRLDKLPIPLPCRAGLRKTILHYSANERGFRLWFANDSEMHVATESSPFRSSGRSSAR
jgi:hypothetical protein